MASFYTSSIKVNDVPMDPAAVTAQFEPVIAAFPDWHWEMRHIVVDGDYIACHFTVTGTHRGAFRGIEATGRRVTTSEFTLYHVEDGKFAAVWDQTSPTLAQSTRQARTLECCRNQLPGRASAPGQHCRHRA